MPRLTTLAVLTVIAVSGLLMGASAPSCAAFLAQGAGCGEACKAAYGSCYKSTANRAACEAQLQRCLEGCAGSKKG